MHSLSPERPLDPDVVSILIEVSREAAACDIACLVVGATARDILLVHVFGHPVRRATTDVDFAIAVESWVQFDHLKARLVSKEGFDTSERKQQRIYYGGKEKEQGYPIDMIPFGAIEETAKTIAWPPDMAVIMNVAGCEEVLTAAEQVEILPGVIVKVASLAGLAALKLIAWSDRGRADPKDAYDLYQIMTQYADAGNTDRLYGEHFSILEAADYDPEIAGAYLLGQDVTRLVSKSTHSQLISILEKNYERLAWEMVRSIRLMEGAPEKVDARLKKFMSGLTR